MAVFETTVTVRCPHEAAFDFLLQPANVLKISPPEMGLRFIDPPERLALGSRFEFQVQAYGQVQTIVHEIVELNSPERFTELQISGPLGHWRHEHVVAPAENEHVTVIDRIEFKPPGGLVGLLVSEGRIRESLEEGFDHRHQELKKLLERTDA